MATLSDSPVEVFPTIAPLDDGQLGELFCLQRCCFVDEAVLYGTPAVPPLEETFDEFTTRLGQSTTLVALTGSRIVGAVSIREYRDPYPDIERLMVAPDLRRGGLALALLASAHEVVRSAGHVGAQLIVGEIATKNQALYTQAGYQLGETHTILETVELRTMIKRF